jgi:hypothetical protein
MTEKENDTPVEEEKKASSEKKEDTNKEAPQEGTKYDGGAIPK